MKTAQSCRLIGLVVMVMAVATTAAADRTSFGQDVLKSAQQLAAGKDSPQNSQIVDGLKEALQVGTDKL